MSGKKRYRLKYPNRSTEGEPQMIWYDNLDLPEGPTVVKEVLANEPKPDARAEAERAPRTLGSIFASPQTGRYAFVAAEIFGAPRARNPWKPKGSRIR